MTDHPLCLSRRVALLALASPAVPAAGRASWESEFAHGLADWGRLHDRWGFNNQQFLRAEAGVGPLMRVKLARGGIDPGTMRRRGLPVSGTGFKAAVIRGGADAAQLNYRLRFAPDFDFVRGGKLPGLYAGTGPSGGRMPNGRDGCSFRLMWREQGAGEVYAYLPTSRRHGTSLLRGRFAFTPGRWHQIRQDVVLNTPGQADGRVSLWFDGMGVGTATGLYMRDDVALRLDGVFFDVFFGGNDDQWAARADTHIDFAGFSVETGVDGDDWRAGATRPAR